MATKTTTFGTLVYGNTFTYSGISYMKVSPRKAAPLVENSGPRMSDVIAMKERDVVTITVPDPIPPTPEEIEARRQRRAMRLVDRFLAHQLEVERWADKLKADPCSAFEWSDGAFQAAARLWVGKALHVWLTGEGREEPVALDLVIKECRRNALRAAQHPKHSTSIPSNLMEQYKASAFAEFAMDFEDRDDA